MPLKLTLDSQYIGGYAVECALKALILDRTPEYMKSETLSKITRGSEMDKPEVLLGVLRDLGVVMPLALSKRIQPKRFRWSTDLRYETTGLDTGETRAFLTTVSAVLSWVREQLT